MPNKELNQLSISELRDLKKRVHDILVLKTKMEGAINAESLRPGMTVRYVGRNNNFDENETFRLEKINKVNAICVSNIKCNSKK